MAFAPLNTRSSLGWKPPLVGMLLATMALNILGLTVPIAASQVFGRILPNPYSPTLEFIVLGGLVIALMDAVLRLGRAAMLSQSHARFAGALTHRILTHVVHSDVSGTRISSSSSLQQLNAVQQLAERHAGQILIGIAELSFLPMIIGCIFYISPLAGIIVMIGLIAFVAVTKPIAIRMKQLASRAQVVDEERYDFLFATLGAIHAIKSMGIEDNILRRYEGLQGRVARDNHELALVTTRLLAAAPIANQAIIAVMLALGAVSIVYGDMTMSGIVALVLLSGRIMAPLQRGVFIFVQLKDVGAAREKIERVLACPRIAKPDDTLDVDNAGRLAFEDVGYGTPTAPILQHTDLSLEMGDVLAVSGADEQATSSLLRLMAGIVAPTSGEVLLNGVPTTAYPQRLLNKCVGYVPPSGALFRGTIRDNITRFGEVSVEDAMSVAEILQIASLIKELPLGLDTPVAGSTGEVIAPGLIQQLAFVRAMAPRPRLILLDRADRGLDGDAYVKLHRFIGGIRGQASFVIVSDDANLVGLASRRCRIEAGSLHFVAAADAQARTAYRDLKL